VSVIRFEEAALAELADAAEYLEQQRPSCGVRLSEAVEAAFGQILEFPNAWPRETKNIRRCPVRGFPYWVLYSQEVDHLLIVAISHSSRCPGYWRDRRRLSGDS
jgi:toxin ParE1/3/4